MNNKIRLFINDVEIPIFWEKNKTVTELFKEINHSEIILKLSKYNNNEQLGNLEKIFIRNDQLVTTDIGDIVLYSGKYIVLFYGSNTWNYTKIGKFNMSKDDTIKILSQNNITLKLTK